jgi:Protein of unknown function (DUF3987)
MVTISSIAVNRRAVIQPKAKDTGWTVPPNLWGGIVARPGFLKSPALQACVAPLQAIEQKWRREDAEALKRFALEKEEHELRYAAWRQPQLTSKRARPLLRDRKTRLASRSREDSLRTTQLLRRYTKS